MKQITQLLSVLFISLTLILSIGCEPDPVEPLGPTLNVLTLNGADVTLDTIDTGASFLINISSLKGDAALNTIEVRENNVTVDASRIIFDGFQAQSNPNPVGGVDAISWDIEITAASEEVTSTYTIIVTDANQKTISASVDITTVDPGTPVTERTMILLLNSSGPAGQGGLDLETGASTGSTPAANFPDTDLRDMGINNALPNDQNWRKQMQSMSSAILKVPAAGVVYADVATIEEVTAIFDAGMTVTDQTDVIAVGDVFVVKTKAGNYFLLDTREVNQTAADNKDNYVFAVKGL